MKILITGVAGLLGSHLSRFLLDKGYSVVGVDDLSGGYSDFLPQHKNFTFYVRTIGVDDISDIFEIEKPKTVFHFAAYAAEGLSPFIRCFNYQNNVMASASVVNECVKHDSKIIFTSSMAVYGDQLPPFKEDLLPSPIDPYGIAKYAVEMDIKQAGEQFGLRYNIIRPHNVLGIYQNIWDKYRNVVGIFIRRTLNNEPMVIYGDGEQTRAFSDVSFYMRPFQMLIEGFDGETFNIGADKEWKIKDIANTVAKIAYLNGYEPKITNGEARHEAKHAFCDHSKAKDKLSFKDDTDLETLVTEMFNWAEKQPKRQEKTMNYEIEKGVYSYWK